MPTAQGIVKCDCGRFVGTFDIDSSPRYVAVDVRPLDLSFECNDATLTYGDVTELVGDCKWTGTAGKVDLQIDFVGGVTIAGLLTTTRSSIRIRGEGSWSVVRPQLSSPTPDGTQRNVRNAPVNSSPPHDTVRDAAKVAREQQLIDLGAPIIAVFGQSGVGKSTFINLIALEQQKVGKGLQSCTRQISAIEAKVGGECVVVIDTPGFDNTRHDVRDEDVVTSIAKYLGTMAERQVYVTGVLILHRIDDIALSQSAYRIATTLKNLCGSNFMDKVTICTTMWDRVTEDEGDDLFDELCETGAWGEMISLGAGTAKIANLCSNAKVEAQRIVTQLIKNAQPAELAIQDERREQTRKEVEVAKIAHEQQLLESGLPIIVIFGQSGVGKSTFINLISSEKQEVDNGLHSCTRDVSVVEAKVGGKPIIVIDTPGIDDTHAGVKEADVFNIIAKLFLNMGQRQVYVTGVLFLHRISDNRFSHTAQRISTMLKNLCGDAAMSHLMLCTTMWDTISPQAGNEYLDGLCKTDAWKEMISKGAATAEIANVCSSAKADAERIVCKLIKNTQTVELAIQDEMVNQAKEVVATKAGRVFVQGQKDQAEFDKKATRLGRRSIWRRMGCVIQ